MLDLSTLDTSAACDKGAKIFLRHPVNNTKLELFIEAVGRDSKRFKEASRANQNARLRRDAVNTRRGKELEIRTVEDIERENLELLAACTLSWNLIEDGKAFSFSYENAIIIYKKYPWIYDQINEGIADLENFLEA